MLERRDQDEKCQRKDWKDHRAACKSIKKTESEAGNIFPPKGIERNPRVSEGFSEMAVEFNRSLLGLSIPQFHKEFKEAFPREKNAIQILANYFGEQQMSLTFIGTKNFDKELSSYGTAPV